MNGFKGKIFLANSYYNVFNAVYSRLLIIHASDGQDGRG